MYMHQPLRIAAGWRVEYNQLYDTEPTRENVENIYGNFQDSLLSVYHEREDILVYVGWEPEFDYDEGGYQLYIMEKDFCGTELFKKKYKAKGELVDMLDAAFFMISNFSRSRWEMLLAKALHDEADILGLLCDPQADRPN